MKLNSQQRCDDVWTWLTELEPDIKASVSKLRKIRDRIKPLPAMLHNNGLLMSLAYLASTTGEGSREDKEIGKYLCERLVKLFELELEDTADSNTQTILLSINKLQQLPFSEFLFAQSETEESLNWMKQLSRAKVAANI